MIEISVTVLRKRIEELTVEVMGLRLTNLALQERVVELEAAEKKGGIIPEKEPAKK